MEVKNYDTILEFDGELIGRSESPGTSPDGPHGRRWHTVEIYRCSDGKYVVAKIGKSTYPYEVERSTAQISDGPEGAVQALYGRDRKGVWKFTYTSEDAANEAADNDPSFAKALLHQKITA